MSNQRIEGEPSSSKNHYQQQYAAMQQQQFMQQQQKGSATGQIPQGLTQFIDNDSQYGASSSAMSGRFGGPGLQQQIDPYRISNLQQFDQKQPSFQQQNMHSNFQGMNNDTSKDGGMHSQSKIGFGENQMDLQQINQMKMYANSQLGGASQANLFQEMLKVNNPIITQNQYQTAPQASNTPLFGQGFLNAASLLANLQQMSQQPQINSQAVQFNDKSPMSGGQTPTNNNAMALQQLLNSNLSQYQSLIDQIEKQGIPTPPNTVSQPQNYGQNTQGVRQIIQPQVSQAPTYNNQQALMSQGYQMNNLNSSLLPSQSDLIRQQMRPYQEEQTPNYSYILNQSRSNVMDNSANIGGFEQEHNTSQKASIDVYNQQYDKNTNLSTKDRPQYNPNTYQGPASLGTYHYSDSYAKPQKQPVAEEPPNFEGYGQRSPASSKALISQQQAIRRNEGSPNASIPWMSKQTSVPSQNEHLSYNMQSNKVNDGPNSPMRQSTHRGFAPDVGRELNYPDQQAFSLLDNSISRSHNIQQQQQYNHGSHNSSQLLQEQHMNSQLQKQQYSPAGSSQYRYDDNDVNSSLNFGKSQRMPGQQQYSGQQQALNIDDIPIGGGRPKTFDELLEENLRKDPLQQQNASFNRDDDNDEGRRKKEFLKRRSQKAPAAAPTKKYNYYVDNFEESKDNKKKEPAQTSSFSRVEESSTHQQLKQARAANPVPVPSNNRSVSPAPDSNNDRAEHNNVKNNQKPKNFLTRGSGTAGGKQGQGKPEKPNRKGKKSANALLSDDEYPNDYNFAAEQDNKSPKLNQAQQLSYLSKQNAVNKRMHIESEINRNSIAEFEQLEQECSDNNVRPRSPKVTQPFFAQKVMQEVKQSIANKRKKKLFDDSDSNDEDDDEAIEEEQQLMPLRRESVVDNKLEEDKRFESTEDLPKSNVVKKFFYKEEPTKAKQQQPKQQEQLSEHLERAMKQKMEQLDKAIDTYNQQSESAAKMKREYEGLLGKQRVDYRDFESKKKREIEEIDKIKNEEIEKLKKERKAVEQRQKNLQMVGVSNKKEREEIDFLKKELQRVSDEAKAKEVKFKSHIERISKQNEELKGVNKEITEELKHTVEQLRATQQAQSNLQAPKAAQQVNNKSESQSNSRYSFNKSQEQQYNQVPVQSMQQIPKGILKNSEPHQKPISVPQFYHPQMESEQQQIDEDDEENGDIGGQLDDDDQDDYESSHPSDLGFDQHKKDNSSQQHHQPQNPVPAITDDDSEDFDMKFPAHYHNKGPANNKVVEQIIGHDGKIQRVYENGKKEVIFNNGVKREVFPDGYTIVYFNNNDIKQTYADQKVVYYFAEAKTTQTTFSDGLQVFKFANNQIEKHFPDGTKEIIFPDGTIKCIFADGEEESIFPDGTIQRIEKNGVKAIEFANGQKDILFPDGTRIREYPDGRVRKTFADGTCENSYRQQ